MLIAAVRSFVTILAVSLYVLITGPIGMLLAVVFRSPGVLYVLGHGGVRLGLLVSGIKYRVEGAERLPRGRAAIYCSNHQSNVDGPVLFEALHPRMHILYKREMDKLPVLGRAFHLGGFIPIDRQDREAALQSIEAGAASIRAGNSFLIFPEGTRSATAELLPFKKGGFVMAIKAQAPVVPVAIQGGRPAMRKGSLIIRPVTVTVRVGEPIETAGLTLNDRQTVIARARASIASMLASDAVVN